MEFIKNKKRYTIIDNIVHIILKNCNPRILYQGVAGSSYYLKKNRKTNKLEQINIGYY